MAQAKINSSAANGHDGGKVMRFPIKVSDQSCVASCDLDEAAVGLNVFNGGERVVVTKKLLNLDHD